MSPPPGSARSPLDQLPKTQIPWNICLLNGFDPKLHYYKLNTKNIMRQSSCKQAFIFFGKVIQQNMSYVSFTYLQKCHINLCNSFTIMPLCISFGCGMSLIMNSKKIVIPLHFLSWKKTPKQCCDTTTPESIHSKDEGKHGSAFAFIFSVNWPVQWM